MYTDKAYNRIGACMVLVFSKKPYIRPIRPYRVLEYKELLGAAGYDTDLIQLELKSYI